MTGSTIPLGCEAVVPVEDVTLLGDGKVKLPDNIKLNSMIRFKGEDVKKGNLLLPMYKHLNGYSLALLSISGVLHILRVLGKRFKTAQFGAFSKWVNGV